MNYNFQFNFIERNFPNETIKTMSTGTHHLILACVAVKESDLLQYADMPIA